MRILQLLPEARPGDAVTHQALRMARALTQLGHQTGLGADAAAPELMDIVQPAPSQLSRPWDLVLDHYSIGANYHRLLATSRHRCWLVYHNITPAHLLAPWAPAIAERCEAGRARLSSWPTRYERALADSTYNAQELLELAGPASPSVEVLPICVEPPSFDTSQPLPSLRRVYEGRGPLLLFVGRVAPQKNHSTLIQILERLRNDGFPGAELLLVGDARGFESYEQALRRMAEKRGLGQVVHFLGKQPDAELWSLYRLADLFCCASKHEGFCVPLVEAFQAGLPVVSTAAGAIPETAGDAALLAGVNEECRLEEFCRILLERHDFCRILTQNGHKQAERFSSAALLERLRCLVG